MIMKLLGSMGLIFMVSVFMGGIVACLTIDNENHNENEKLLHNKEIK